MSEDTTVLLQRCLDRLQAGDEAARKDLLNAACARLTRLAGKMLRSDGRLARAEETGDVFQSAVLRLWNALQKVTPGSLREFFRLAALQIRRELIDLAHYHYGRPGEGGTRPVQPGAEADSQPPGAGLAGHSSLEPGHLAIWAEFHQQIAALPEEEREVFDLVWYQGLTHAEAAAVLSTSTKTVQRRWQAARLKLYQAMDGNLPGL